ncbi:MAG TPA: YfhO family protein [Candidatus Omnitrophota bacterium]|nr:YfhO family protein [Candidatus Omnitrophota bacterium]
MKKDAAAIGLFGAITLLFFMPFVTGVNLFGFRDLSLYFYPLRQLMVGTMKAGHLPLWDPYIFCGIPFFATLQAGFLYPVSALLYILPFNIGFNWSIIVHYFMAAAFTYLMMRHFKVSRSGSFLSGMAFAFSGYLLSVSNMNTSLSSVVWLPLTLLFWDRAIGEASPRGRSFSLLSLVLVLSLMFLGGEPTIFYSTFVVMFFYALFMDRTAKLLYLPAILLAAAGLLAVQILPFAEYVAHSVRTWRTEFSFISHSSFPVREALNFVFPNFFGNFMEGTYSRAILGPDQQTWILSPYMGALTFLLAVIALFKRSRKVYFFAFTALFFLLLAFGKYTPFYEALFYSMPYLSAIRYPVKFLFFPAFAVAVMAGWGLNELKAGLHKSELAAFWGMKGALSSLLLLSLVFSRQIYRLLSSGPRLSGYDHLILHRLIEADTRALYLLAAIVLAAAAAAGLYYFRKISAQMFVAAIVFLVFADLFCFNYKINPPIPAALFSGRPANAEAMAYDRGLFRFFVDPNVFERSGTFYAEQKDILFSLRSKLSSNMMIVDRMSDWYGRESIEPIRNARLYWAYKDDLISVHTDILSYSNVKYILSFEKLKGSGFRPLLDKDFYLYQNLQAKERAYLDGGSVTIESYAPENVVVSADSPAGGRLVLADNYYPGWKAFVDGKETAIKRTYYLFRGVDLAPGRHEVKFVYDPLSVKLGAGISLATALLLCGYFFFKRREKA